MVIDLTIVVPFYNGADYIDRLLVSLPDGIPVIIVDDHSDVPLKLDTPDHIRIVRPEKKGYFSGATNYGIEQCETDVLVLNQDSWFDGDRWLDSLNKFRDEFALIGERVAGTPRAWPKGYIHGTFMFMRRDAINSVGLMNASMYPLWGSTCEWQLRICRSGYKVKMLNSIPDFNHEKRNEDEYGSAITQVMSDYPDSVGLFLRIPPLVSVVIPCYNYGRFLKDAVNSLVGGETSLGYRSGQTLQSFEIVIVDDASTDDSLSLATELHDPMKGIRVLYHKTNKGTAATINTGIKHSHGRFVTVLSADDMMEPDRLEVLYSAARKNPHSVICDNCTVVTNGDYVVVDGLKKVFKMKDYDFESIIHKNTMHSGIFYPMSAWAEAGGYPEIFGNGREDWAFNVALGVKGWCGVVLKDYDGYLYRRDGYNRSMTNTNPQGRKQFVNQLQETFPDLYKGYRDTVCCGNQKTSRGNVSDVVGGNNMLLQPGEGGMVEIEYIGASPVNQTYWGDETATRYVFGRKKRGYVDSTDLAGFLKQTNFQLVPVVKETLVSQHVFEVEDSLINDPIVIESGAFPDPVNPILNPSDVTVTAVIAYLSETELSASQLVDMVDMETDGKNRSSALTAIETAIESNKVNS